MQKLIEFRCVEKQAPSRRLQTSSVGACSLLRRFFGCYCCWLVLVVIAVQWPAFLVPWCGKRHEGLLRKVPESRRRRRLLPLEEVVARRGAAAEAVAVDAVIVVGQ